ncbi:hypothetical protein A3B42_01150 [Candidatus Daviesbacteria bacterium RIFCSPLOWO2_01_FULL_38_10]|uniref:UDP-N-acetylmuramoyl-tripeptide-D-alanyl-D-alanine ligase MurF n=1 Tax=Candidatus Daviesbacteria bacterium GW2011_GWF2_38_6 TaxID=1618432 RepID=A0A0G0KSG3_9BACT|nr:MAG: UDP-N-acetylmuramoyl-tripeptide-D-alanyl-D-alanine ligase MurF [Candidatus Daviesbacteria bacterium GW2011_GWA2_38_17]KKQ78485.1 MAG: UDP-N-acetylmuramoyl-tripeptide-D-alanyl-D-alanine ligase MurF [Candidatus Daviesbacteria bacterium GW2011_GWF2_38_6]OGE26554.1 MAG: hypothetical protein A3D02_04695 [Candidatus Daviesbacteria bacterium RIFCSPHIGHO2_02_FULL_39_41]OGE27435.1 MAG: hypothetical protein A2772_01615 [Candidatus Daviesbacteria bacterium RIFCSPHIGHO2_01_FULL_38_8b]OGE37149.1 MAG
MFKNYLAGKYSKLYSRETFVAVCGSAGKTVATLAAGKVLSHKYKTITTDSYHDSTIAIPGTILKLNPTTKRGVFELSIKIPGQMDFYLSLIQPKVVLITRGEKQMQDDMIKLVEQIPQDGALIINAGDIDSKKLAEKCKGQVLYFGEDPQNCTIWAGNIKTENFSTTFELNLGVERVKVIFPFLGRHNVYSALAAALLGVLENIPLTKIKIALESLSPLEHHLQIMDGPNNSIILDDTINATPLSVEAAIDTLMQIPARRRVLVLGEMKYLGESSDRMHREVAQKIYKEKLDLVFLSTGEALIIADELKNLGFWEEKVEANLQHSQLVGKLLKILGSGDVCLIKGQRSSRLDEVVKRVRGSLN